MRLQRLLSFRPRVKERAWCYSAEPACKSKLSSLANRESHPRDGGCAVQTARASCMALCAPCPLGETRSEALFVLVAREHAIELSARPISLGVGNFYLCTFSRRLSDLIKSHDCRRQDAVSKSHERTCAVQERPATLEALAEATQRGVDGSLVSPR